MKVLSLETSTHQGSLAVWQDGTFLYSEKFQQPRGRGNTLLRVLEQVVKKFGSMDRIAVGTGPGSYNGIRAAIAAAEGLRIAWKVSVLGIPSVLAVPSAGKQYAVVGDARGGTLFFGSIEGENLKELVLLPCEEFKHRLEAWQGPAYTAAAIPEFPHLILQAPTAEKLAILAATRPNLAETPTPLYLKPPYITQPSIRSGRGAQK